MRGGAHMREAYTWSNANVKERWAYVRGGGEIYRRRNTVMMWCDILLPESYSKQYILRSLLYNLS